MLSSRSVVLPLFVVLLLASACGKGGDPAAAGAAGAPAAQAVAPPVATTLDGNWQTACLPYATKAKLSQPGFFKEQYVFGTARSYTFVRNEFRDADCKASSAAGAAEATSGSYELGNKTMARVRASGVSTFGATLALKRVEATEINLLTNSPAEKTGKFYLAYRIQDGKLVLGSPSPEQAKIPSVDVSKVFSH